MPTPTGGSCRPDGVPYLGTAPPRPGTGLRGRRASSYGGRCLVRVRDRTRRQRPPTALRRKSVAAFSALGDQAAMSLPSRDRSCPRSRAGPAARPTSRCRGCGRAGRGRVERLRDAHRRLDVEPRQELLPKASVRIRSFSISRWPSCWNSEMLPSSWLRRSMISPGFTGTLRRAVGLILISQISSGMLPSPIELGRISSSTGGLSENRPSQ